MNVSVDISGLEALDTLTDSIESKVAEFLNRLAQIGMEQAQLDYVMARYDGEKDVSVTTEQRGETVVAIVATGKSVLFLEFGAGYLFGFGHPEADKYDMGPGTYPTTKPEGKQGWNAPNGWWFGNGQHTYGNAPSMGMYNARKEIEQSLTRIAREVFA